MKNFARSLFLLVCLAMGGCGGDDAKSPAANGGSTGSGSGGSSASGGSTEVVPGTGGNPGMVGSGGSAVGGSGTGGAGKTDGGQASSRGDAMTADNTCPAFTPCGGSVVGTWYLKSECLENAKSFSCVGYGVSFETPGSTLVYTFNADGTFRMSTPGTLRETVRYPIACLRSDAGAAQTCSDLQEAVRQSASIMGDAGTSTTSVESFACALEADQVCVCTEVLGTPAASVTGTYSTSGNQISATALVVSPMPDGGIGDAGAGPLVDYCVSGNTFMYRGTDSSTTMVVTMIK